MDFGKWVVMAALVGAPGACQPEGQSEAEKIQRLNQEEIEAISGALKELHGRLKELNPETPIGEAPPESLAEVRQRLAEREATLAELREALATARREEAEARQSLAEFRERFSVELEGETPVAPDRSED